MTVHKLLATFFFITAHDNTRGADKSLARPTFWCHWTETIVSLERGVCPCAEL